MEPGSTTRGKVIARNNYIGRHRSLSMKEGIGLIPLGDRKRVRPTEINLVGNAEEVDSVDKYSKYSKLSH